MLRVSRQLRLSPIGWVYWFGSIGAAIAASWVDFSLGWKLNWRLLVDLMVHKEFDSQYNGTSSVGEPANGTKGLSLLDLMLRLNGIQEEQER
ncbi:DNA repair protein rhp26-like protein [Anopheles sinensis]|uniref:DNA repair protein rhp26-like protein n=1 Tax=Anopheles sinensis TaxID=74873 RepID=A0A084WST4_ANOSI|nr:DNA repair protein rhp26-like protein [Anopheles sinensis]